MVYEDPDIDFSGHDLVDKIKKIVQTPFQTSSRHGPLFIYGNDGSGKTSLLKTVYKQVDSWFNTNRVLRFVRFASKTPRSSYNLEILRIISQQICIALRLPDGFLPKDASFDPLYVNNWFQNLIRMFENLNQILVIFIDDLHTIASLDKADAMASLNWIPISLPDNVHLIFTVGMELDCLRLTNAQKEKFKSQDCWIELPVNPKEQLVASIEKSLAELSDEFGSEVISRLAAHITCSEYGFTETEILELLMPMQNTDNFHEPILMSNGNLSFSHLCQLRRKMGTYL